MRYLPLSDLDRAEMLARIGVDQIDALFADVPADALLREPLDLPRRKGELEVERVLARMAGKNVAASSAPFFIGAGAYKHHVPASVDHLIQRSEFLTSYTPYQPEIAQGTLQYLFEFQTQVANLTSMEVANASMYDGSTGTGEAVLMAHRVTKRRKAVLSGGLHPQYADVVKTLSRMAGDEVVALAPDVTATEDLLAQIDDTVSCVVVQTPDFFGNLRDLRAVADKAHKHGALLIAVFTEAVSLGLVTPPGEMGADIVVGEGQSIGNALSFGGPLRRPLRHEAEVPAPDARAASAARPRTPTAARLRAHALDPRAAYPPRQGDLEYLHQFRALLPRLHDPHDAARRGGAEAPGAGQPRECGEAGRDAGRFAGRRGAEPGVLQRVHAAAAKACDGGRRGARPTRRSGRRPGLAPAARGGARRPAAGREHGGEHRRGSGQARP
jgi:hypothetical protein